MAETPWGTDGVVSLPEALETTETSLIDFEGFCFTPDGIRVNLTRAEREDLLLSAFRPGERHGQG